MVRTRPIILHLVLMLITKVVTSPPVRFQSLVDQERIPIRVIKYVNIFVRFSFIWPFLYSLDYSFVRSLFLSLARSFVRSLARSLVRSFVRSFVRSLVRSFVCPLLAWFKDDL